MILVADNLTIVQPAVAQAIEKLDPAPIRHIVSRCEQAGAQAIDINPGPLTRAPAERMRFFVETVRSVTRLPLVLDTANPVALEAGLAACEGQAIINGFSLEPDKLERILPLANRYPADIVGYVLTCDSRVPIAEEEMLTLAVSLFEAFAETGLPPQRLIIDPVVVPLSWPDGQRHNHNLVNLIWRLPELLGVPVRTMVGLSNLTSGAMALNRKIALEQIYLPMLAAAGVDLVMVNMFHSATVETAAVCDALRGDRIFAWPHSNHPKVAVSAN